jgi:hypothetical protein
VVVDNGKVSILSLLGPGRQTARGLRVGDRAERARRLYDPCYADSAIVQVCFSREGSDPRTVIAQIAEERVKRLDIGRIIEP